MDSIKLDINILNYSIDEMKTLFEIINNAEYNKKTVQDKKNALIINVKELNISNEKKKRVIQFIKQVAYNLNNNIEYTKKVKKLKNIAKQQLLISKKLDNLHNNHII
tara:strand:- start:99 stop:419 length:321 start_codon:yes stop_codon:yes gene_type:complete